VTTEQTTQPQLLKMSLVPGDVVFTVNFFQPSGRVLEPCAGDGAFLKHLPPQTEWCEIDKGKDFFLWREPVDWIVGNPPYSTAIFLRWLRHSFALSADVVYILPTKKVFQSFSVMDLVSAYGGIRSILAYGRAGDVGFPFGFSIAAFHFSRNWKGDAVISFRKRQQVSP
jgi:hypothetical protein